MRDAKVVAVAVALWISAAQAAWAQQPKGTLEGVVEGLPGTLALGTVTVRNVETGLMRREAAQGGLFTVRGLPLGTYDVEFEALCQAPISQRVQLADGSAPLRIRLTPQAAERLVVGIEDAFRLTPLPDVTVRLGSTGETAVTDASGRVELDCGRILNLASTSDQRPVRFFASKPDYFTTSVRWFEEGRPIERGNWESMTLEERARRAQRALLYGLYPIEGTPDQAPGTIIELDGGADDVDVVDPRVFKDTSTFRVGNQVLEERTNDTAPDVVREGFQNSFKKQGVGVRARVNLKTDVFGYFRAVSPTPAQAGAEAAQRRVPRGLTTFTAGIARSGEELRYDKIDDAAPGGRDTTWEGTGTVVRAGLDQSLRLGRGFRLRLGYEYERLLDTDMTRSPGLSAAGGRLVGDQGHLSRQSHLARATVVWSGRHVAPWAGVRLNWETVRLTGEATAEYSLPQGLLQQQISFENEFNADRALADLGLDVRIPGTRLFLRAEGATNGSDARFALGASYGWFRVR